MILQASELPETIFRILRSALLLVCVALTAGLPLESEAVRVSRAPAPVRQACPDASDSTEYSCKPDPWVVEASGKDPHQVVRVQLGGKTVAVIDDHQWPIAFNSGEVFERLPDGAVIFPTTIYLGASLGATGMAESLVDQDVMVRWSDRAGRFVADLGATDKATLLL